VGFVIKACSAAGRKRFIYLSLSEDSRKSLQLILMIATYPTNMIGTIHTHIYILCIWRK